MFKMLSKPPKQIFVAFSGGVDSVAVVDFLSKKHNVECLFFHHGTENSEKAFNFVSRFCTDKNLSLSVGFIKDKKPKHLSQEEFWRDERYRFLESFNATVVTAHNLDDCVETYVFGSLHGQPKVIPYKRNNIIRPFLTTEKIKFVDWCQRKNIQWCEDLSNADTKFMRNYIRHEIIPHALKVNPGLYTVVKKIVQRQFVEDTLKSPL